MLLTKRGVAFALCAGWLLASWPSMARERGSLPRRVCPGGVAPAGAGPAEAAPASVFLRVASVAGVRISLGVAPGVDRFCVTPTAVVFGPGDLDAASAAGRIAYAIGVWAAWRGQNARGAEVKAASHAGCLLARLGVFGDDLTTQVVDVRDWSGPHRDARRFTRAVRGGYAACVAR